MDIPGHSRHERHTSFLAGEHGRILIQLEQLKKTLKIQRDALALKQKTISDLEDRIQKLSAYLETIPAKMEKAREEYHKTLAETLLADLLSTTEELSKLKGKK